MCGRTSRPTSPRPERPDRSTHWPLRCRLIRSRTARRAATTATAATYRLRLADEPLPTLYRPPGPSWYLQGRGVGSRPLRFPGLPAEAGSALTSGSNGAAIFALGGWGDSCRAGVRRHESIGFAVRHSDLSPPVVPDRPLRSGIGARTSLSQDADAKPLSFQSPDAVRIRNHDR